MVLFLSGVLPFVNLILQWKYTGILNITGKMRKVGDKGKIRQDFYQMGIDLFAQWAHGLCVMDSQQRSLSVVISQIFTLFENTTILRIHVAYRKMKGGKVVLFPALPQKLLLGFPFPDGQGGRDTETNPVLGMEQ